jgi:hypothetical protein
VAVRRSRAAMLRWKVGPAIGLDIATQRGRIRFPTHVLRRHVLAATEGRSPKKRQTAEVSMCRMVRAHARRHK